MSAKALIMQLLTGSKLQDGKYTIVKFLGQGGFGITYQAKTDKGDVVAVKEFFMKDSCIRADDSRRVSVPSKSAQADVERFRLKFIKEARRLQQLDHPNIVKVFDVFSENDTDYYVMQYLDGGSLSDNVKQFGPMDELTAKEYILQVAMALRYMHQEKHICHYDVKPGNILLSGGKAILIDFGLSKNYDDGGQQTSSTPVGISAGYAPLEQYQQTLQEFSPATDIYALGATLYFLLSGKNPPEASVVLEQGLSCPAKMIPPTWNAIQMAMMPVRRQRLQSIDAFCWTLDPSGTLSPDRQVKTTQTEGDNDERQTVTVEQVGGQMNGLYEGQQQPYGPQAGYQPASGYPPKTWMVESILVLIFCCLPFGIVGVVYASKVSGLYAAGHYAEAEQASLDAGKWTKWGFYTALIVYGILLLLQLAA